MPRSSQPSASKPKLPTPKTTVPAVQSFQNPLSSVGTTNPSAPTFGQTLKEGFSFGMGSAIAHRIFNPFPTVVEPSQKKSNDPCEKERMAFETCMKTRSPETFCGGEQMSYTQCISLQSKINIQ